MTKQVNKSKKNILFLKQTKQKGLNKRLKKIKKLSIFLVLNTVCFLAKYCLQLIYI